MGLVCMQTTSAKNERTELTIDLTDTDLFIIIEKK